MNVFNKQNQDIDTTESFEEGIPEIENEGMSTTALGGHDAPRSGKKKLFFMLGLVVVLIGGYVAYSKLGQDAPPPVQPVAAVPEAPMPVETAASAETPVPADVALPPPPPEEALVTPPADVTISAMPAETVAPVAAPDAALPPPASAAAAPEAPTIIAAMPEAPPVAAPADVSMPAPIADAPSMPAAPIVEPAKDLPVPSALNSEPAAIMPEMPPQPPMPAPMAQDASVATMPPPAPETALPAEIVSPAGTASGMAPAGVVPQQPPTAEAQPAATGAAPSAAEMAIVQNSAVLDQLSAPSSSPMPPAAASGSRTDIGADEAQILDLPEKYVVVKKDRSAEDLDSQLKSARTALAQNRNTAALELFTEIEKDHPEDVRVIMGKAVALQRLGQAEAAMAAYEQVLEKEPKNVEVLTNMLGLLKAQDPELALKNLSDLRETYPYNPEITAQLAVAYGQLGQYQEALKYLDIADTLQPGNAFVIYNRAVLFDKMGRSAEAISFYRQILKMYSDGDLEVALPIDSIKKRLATLR